MARFHLLLAIVVRLHSHIIGVDILAPEMAGSDGVWAVDQERPRRAQGCSLSCGCNWLAPLSRDLEGNNEHTPTWFSVIAHLHVFSSA